MELFGYLIRLHFGSGGPLGYILPYVYVTLPTLPTLLNSVTGGGKGGAE